MVMETARELFADRPQPVSPAGVLARIREARQVEDAAAVEVLWVRGGNVFTLRHVVRTSGLETLLPTLLRDDALVYAGYSAGPCLLAPSLRGLERCDDAGEVRRLHGADPIFDGLGVLDFAFVPHVDSDGHPESEVLGQVARRYAASGVPHRTLRDGQALVVDRDRTELV
jgi:dipeptidase E